MKKLLVVFLYAAAVFFVLMYVASTGFVVAT